MSTLPNNDFGRYTGHPADPRTPELPEDYLDESSAKDRADDEWRGRGIHILEALSEVVTDDSEAEPVYVHNLAQVLLRGRRELTPNELLSVVLYGDETAVILAARHLRWALDDAKDAWVAGRAKELLEEQDKAERDARDESAMARTDK